MAPKKIRRIGEETTLTDFDELRKEASELFDGKMLESRLLEIDELEQDEADNIIEIKTEVRDIND